MKYAPPGKYELIFCPYNGIFAEARAKDNEVSHLEGFQDVRFTENVAERGSTVLPVSCRYATPEASEGWERLVKLLKFVGRANFDRMYVPLSSPALAHRE